ncbi:MAG: NAD-dependent epimerase/dehydratase family protein, partial [Candidatus Hydrogenedentota bacterium]
IAGQSVVFDCVGSMSAAASMQDSVTTFRQECQAHVALFDACAALEFSPVVVFPSTRLVYGMPKTVPVDETHPTDPMSNYALAKLTVEKFLDISHRTFGLRSRVFRLSNPYAPQVRIDQCQYNIISRFALAISRGEKVQIYGDGSQLRDYVHIYDVVSTFLTSGADEDPTHEVFNLGGPEAISIRDAVQLFVEAVDGPKPEFVPWPEVSLQIETGNYYSNIDKLTSRYELPPFTSPRTGLKELILNYERQKEGEKTVYAR